MSATLIPDMVQSGFRQVKDAVDQRSAHATEAGNLELLTGYQIAATLIESLGRYLEAVLAAGGEKEQLLKVIDHAATALDLAVPVLRSFSEASPGLPARDAQFEAAVSRINAAAEEADALRKKVESLRQLLNRPRRPLDVSGLPVSEEDIQRGTYKTLDEALTEL